MLDDLLINLDSSELMNNTYSPINKKINFTLSSKRLQEIQEEGDLPKARYLATNDNRISYRSNKYTRQLKSILSDIVESVVFKSGFFYYPPGAYCGWHTNSNFSGHKNRLYLVWAKEANKSFFRYVDNKTKQIVTKYDKPGWQMRQFSLDNKQDNLFWHCVGAHSDRVSVGFAYA